MTIYFFNVRNCSRKGETLTFEIFSLIALISISDLSANDIGDSASPAPSNHLITCVF